MFEEESLSIPLLRSIDADDEKLNAGEDSVDRGGSQWPLGKQTHGPDVLSEIWYWCRVAQFFLDIEITDEDDFPRSLVHSSTRELTATPKNRISLRQMKAEKSSEVVARDDAATNWHENWS